MSIPTNISRSTRTQTGILVGVACLLIGGFFLFWRGPMPLEGSLRMFALKDDMGFLASNPVTLRWYYALTLGAAFVTVGLLLLSAVVWTRLNERTQNAIFQLTATLASSSALVIFERRMGYDPEFMRVSALIRNASAHPIFGHRLLFVWIARAFVKVAPNISDLQAYHLSQCVAILLAVYALGKWSAVHAGKSLGWLGQIIGVVLISTCILYYNFYDIGYVFFTTCGLLAIYTRKYWWLVAVMLIGTLNYEGVLLLIPVAAYLAFDEDSPKTWIPPIATSLVVYCAVRFALNEAIPFPKQVDWRVWTNMTAQYVRRKEMTDTLLALPVWYATGLMCMRFCNPRLKRMTLLFPLVFAVTFLFGEFHEPRQFDAFIPVLVAIILSAARNKFEFEILVPSSAAP